VPPCDRGSYHRAPSNTHQGVESRENAFSKTSPNHIRGKSHVPIIYGSGILPLRGLLRPCLRLTMPCLLLLIILLFPRVVLVLMWISLTYLQRAFHGGLVLPVLGFIFLPLTTIVYAWELNSGMPTVGINLLWLLICGDN